MLLTSILILVLIILFLRSVFCNWKFYVLSWKLPGPVALPIIGNVLELWRYDDITQAADKFSIRYSSPTRFWLGSTFYIVITDPERTSKIISSTKFLQKNYSPFKEFLGEGLITGSGPKWKKDRRLMAPIFSQKSNREYFDNIAYHTNGLIKILDKKLDGPYFNIEKYLHRCATDFVNETILGVRTNAQNGELDALLYHISRGYVIAHTKIVKIWLQVEWIYRLTHYYKEQKAARKTMYTTLRDMLHEVEQRRRKRDHRSESFLDKILDNRDTNPSLVNENELVDHLLTLFLASEDTIANIVAFTLLLFGMYPEIQDKAFQEIAEVIGDSTEIIFEDLHEMKYLQMCINDVLRLFPIAPFIMRVSSEDFTLDEFVIPKGCSVTISIYNIHRDPKLWERPNDFYPEHFLPGAVERRHTFAFLPFSAGPRGCLGKPYAYMAMTVLVARILKEYQIVAQGVLKDLKLKTDVSIRTKDHQYPVKISRRRR